MELSWLEFLVETCRAAGVPIWVKQDCGRREGQRGRIPDALWIQQHPVEETT